MFDICLMYDWYTCFDDENIHPYRQIYGQAESRGRLLGTHTAIHGSHFDYFSKNLIFVVKNEMSQRVYTL